jgi:hypothetical protein
MPATDVARESRLRRRLKREHGWALRRSHRRNPKLPECGLYRIVDPELNVIVVGGEPWDYSMDLDAVEAWLEERAAARS